MIEIKNVSKVLNGVQALKNVSLNINKGEVISLIGRSGVGKSTLIRCINSLDQPYTGDVLIEGESIINSDKPEKIRQKMGMVFQKHNLLDHLTVMKNLTIAPIRLLKQNKQDAETRAIAILEKVGLAHKANTISTELSGGQMQRVAIARCLMMNPKVILFDEPTSALDPIMTSEVLSLIYSLAKDGMTMVVVTHNLKFAKEISTRVVYMEDGSIIEDDSPDVIFGNAKNVKTREFVNHEVKLYKELSDYSFLKQGGHYE